MEAVKVWSFSVCIAIVIGAITSMIAPSLTKHKIIRIVISVFVLAGIMSPLVDVLDETNLSLEAVNELNNYEEFEGQQALEEDILNKLEDAVDKTMYDIVKQELLRFGIEENFGMHVDLVYQKDGISVEGVNIAIEDLHMIEQERLAEELEKNLGFPVSVDVFNLEEK